MAWQALDVDTDHHEALALTIDPADLIDATAVLAELIDRPAWMADAACREHPELDWFSTRPAMVDACRDVCASCLAWQDCTTYATEGREQGIWGGLSKRERRAGVRSAA